MEENPSADHLIAWIKQKKLEELALFFLDAHAPVLNIFKQVGIAASFLIPLFGAQTWIAQIIALSSAENAAGYLRSRLEPKTYE